MDAVEEIKNRLNIEDVVGEYVQLKRAGRNFKGLSPFSNERTPSLMVSPEKQIWHDFSSGKGGNIFSFVMEMEGLEFKGVLELLARKAGVDLEQFRRPGVSRGPGTNEKERLYEVLEAATHFYQLQFTKCRPALEYVLQKRAFSKATALEWRIGYSPDGGTALVDYLHSKGFSEKEMKGAGLTAQRYRGPVDMFRGRIMIPLADPQGRIIGFTARQLVDDPNGPKYINTPQTPLYDKSRHVFGLHLAKDAIRRTKFVVLAEGNLDVIASNQAGVKQIVATAGTALTEWQLKTLGRFTPDIRLSFDADAAGLSATERAIPIASKVGVSLSIITIPNGKDPDELIRNDKAAWEQIIQKPQYALDWLIDRYKNQLDISTGPGKKQFSDILLKTVEGLSDPVEREHYMQHIADLLHVSREVLSTKYTAIVTPVKVRLKVNKVTAISDKATADFIRTQNHLLALALLRPELRKEVQTLQPQILPDEPARQLLKAIQQDPEIVVDSPALSPLEDYAKIVTLLFEEVYQDDDALELSNEAVRLRSHLITQYVKTQKQRIAHELQTADPDRTKQLLEAVKKLDSLLKSR